MATTVPSVSSAAASLSRPGSAARRSHRQPKASDAKELSSQATSVSSAGSSRAKSQSTSENAPSTNADDSNASEGKTDPANPAPWKHPDELPYIRREDWSQDLMLEYLIQKSFTIPPRDVASNPLMEVIPKEGSVVTLPRKYRVPLMFLAKFQWESLRLVLNAANPETEWQEFKFDIIHITRLCQHLFHQARDAKEKAGMKGLDKMWRSPMFDRVLTRFYHHWFISREWSLKHFYEEFEEEEYQNDILKNDWARWSIKGHKGFRLTKEEIQNGITAEEFMRGLRRNADGVWTWITETGSAEEAPPAPVPSTEPVPLPPPESLDAITNVTPTHDTIEVKHERLEAATNELTEQAKHKQAPAPALKSSTPGNFAVVQASSDPAQLAGTKRPREEDDSPADHLPSSPRKRTITARKTLAEAYRYGQSRSPSKLAQATASSPKDKALEILEGSSSPTKPEKLSIKLKRTTASVVLPAQKKKRVAEAPGDAISSSDLTSISAPVAKAPRKRARKTSLKAAETSNDPTTSSPMTASSSETLAKHSAAKPSEPSKSSPVISTLPFTSSNTSSGISINKSSAAILVPSNPKQHMSYVPSGPDSPLTTKVDMIVDSIVPPVTSVMTPTHPISTASLIPTSQTPKDTNPTSTIVAAAPNENSDSTSSSIASDPKAVTSPSNPTLSSSHPISNIPNSSKSPLLFNTVSESIIARGLLGMARQPFSGQNKVDAEPSRAGTDASTSDGLESSQIIQEPTPDTIHENGPLSTILDTSTGVKIDHARTTEANPAPERNASGSQPVLSKSDPPKAPLSPETISNSSSVLQLPTSISRSSSGNQIGPSTSKNGVNDDKMVVDNVDRPSPPSRDRSITSESSVGLLMAHDTRAKSLHTILLLRDLLEFVRSPSVPHPVHPEPGLRSILDARTRRLILDEEEAITVDQRLDVLAHASVALAKVLYPFRGSELERRIVSLDKRLQQQFDMVWSVEDQLSAAMQLRARISPDKGVQTSSFSISRGMQTIEEPVVIPEPPTPVIETSSQGIQTQEELTNKEVHDIGIQTEVDAEPETIPQQAEPPIERRASPLSSDATMVDLSQPLEPPPPSETPKPTSSLDLPRRSEPVAKIMMSIMRNMADLLECSALYDGPVPMSPKGKEREGETGDLRLPPSNGYAGSPIVSSILNEFKNMKEEIRHSEQWSREEARSLSLHHSSEVDSLKDEIRVVRARESDLRAREQIGKERLAEANAEIERLKASLRAATKGKGKEESMDDGTKTPASLELQDLRRRITSLELRSRLDGLGLDATGTVSQGSPASGTPSELPAARSSQWQSHPLGHLMTQEYHSAFSLSPHLPKTMPLAKESSSKPGTPKPGTPLSADRPAFFNRLTDGGELEENPPLPAKSQRKLHMMMFPRAPLG